MVNIHEPNYTEIIGPSNGKDVGNTPRLILLGQQIDYISGKALKRLVFSQSDSADL